MSSLAYQLVCPELLGLRFLLDDLLSSDEDDNIEQTRVYKIQIRRAVNNWDDMHFRQRFRLTKPSFYKLLNMVTPYLAANQSTR